MDKKGFTLAELLIVVAIIAVLTAIAVPLFVGALNNAEESVKDANIRAVRGEAIAAILTASEGADPYKVLESDGTRKGSWKFTAKVSKQGQVTEFKMEEKGDSVTGIDSCVKAADGKNYTVTVYVAVDDLNKKDS